MNIYLQLGQYGRILQTGNLYGFGQLQEAIQHGTIRGLADIGRQEIMPQNMFS